MEDPLPAEAFGLGRRLALGWDLNKKKGGAHITLFGPDLNGSIGDSGYSGRGRLCFVANSFVPSGIGKML